MATAQSLEDSIASFDRLTSHPEKYLSLQEDISHPAKALTKSIYDFTKSEEKKLSNVNILPNLIIDNFDEEQIWQEIELQNEHRWTHLLENVSKFLNKQNDLVIPVNIGNVDDREDEDEDENGGEDENENEDEESIPKKLSKKKKEKNDNPSSDDVLTNGKSKKGLKLDKKPKGSIVDDDFFQLKSMEEFLDAQDKLEMKKSKKSQKRKRGDESESDEEEEEIDLFENWESDEDEDAGDDETSSKKHKYSKYADFFNDNSESEGSGDGDDKNKNYFNDAEGADEEMESDDDEEIDLQDDNTNFNNKKKVRFSEPQPSSSDDDSNDEDVSTNKKVEPENLSEFQLRQERLNKKISHLEHGMLQEKAWPMKGEVDATTRPQNSLLEEVVDFDVTSRPAPVITEETTLKLQDIIIQRIKDKSWDDVERKSKPVRDVQEFKKQLVLDQEKSKLSLAQVYERDYVKQRDALDPDADEKPEEEPPEHIEIRSMISSLFSKLDALCNFHYTPKISAPEVKIVSNIPAIDMEEVAPVATSDATLLAPEEIKAKQKGDIIGKSERTDTDKKRERRQKKMHQREREKEKRKRSKLIEKLNPGLGNKYSKEKVAKQLEKVTKDRNVDKMTVTQDKKSYTSSTAFFTQLQDEVSNTIKTTLQKSNAKGKKGMSAKRLKL